MRFTPVFLCREDFKKIWDAMNPLDRMSDREYPGENLILPGTGVLITPQAGFRAFSFDGKPLASPAEFQRQYLNEPAPADPTRIRADDEE